MPHFILVTQLPKPKSLGIGSLSISKKGEAQFFEGDASSGSRILASMDRVKVDWAAAAGILISGFQNNGTSRDGRIKYVYQEWLLRHLQPNTN